MIHSSNPKTPSWPVLAMPELLAVGSMRASDGAAVAEMLRRAGPSIQRKNAPAQDGPRPSQPVLVIAGQRDSLEDWADWLADNPQGHLLLLVNLPSVAIARRLAEGTMPQAALAQWQERAQTTLDIIRAHRRRISVLFAEPVRMEPQAFLHALAHRLSIQLQTAEISSKPSQLPAALLRMMAENALLQSAEARLLATELEANALPLPEAQNSCQPAVDEVFAEYRNTIDAEARAAVELREENQLLLEQLQRVQEKMEAFSIEKQRAEQRAADALRQGTTNKDQQLQDLQEENELLLQQLHHVQEELEHYYLQSTQDGSAWQHNTQLQAAHDTIRAIYNSYSWRLTKPLRWVLRAFGAAPGHNEKAPLPDTAWEAQDTIQALYNSKSWKITKPLRVLLDLFTGGSKTD